MILSLCSLVLFFVISSLLAPFVFLFFSISFLFCLFPSLYSLFCLMFSRGSFLNIYFSYLSKKKKNVESTILWKYTPSQKFFKKYIKALVGFGVEISKIKIKVKTKTEKNENLKLNLLKPRNSACQFSFGLLFLFIYLFFCFHSPNVCSLMKTNLDFKVLCFKFLFIYF